MPEDSLGGANKEGLTSFSSVDFVDSSYLDRVPHRSARTVSYGKQVDEYREGTNDKLFNNIPSR